jgi:hypothetical protein
MSGLLASLIIFVDFSISVFLQIDEEDYYRLITDVGLNGKLFC